MSVGKVSAVAAPTETSRPSMSKVALTSWLGVVVGRRARRIARRGAGLREKAVSLDALSPEATSHLAVDQREDQTPRQLALAQLTEAIESLSQRDRLLLQGAFYERRSYADLAETLGVKTDSVGQLLYRAKSRLKKKLGGERFLESLSGTVPTMENIVL